MPYVTDERLKSFLDTNQLAREQLCLAVLAADKRFSEVRPRHPRGGPDGGRDIEAVFRGGQRTFGAVGFLNQANDSDEQRRQIKSKFDVDLESALAADLKPVVFVFFTNINLTVGQKDELIERTRARGLLHCEIFDRERLRITLDSVDGFAIRFQLLGIELSGAEQASFFARWGGEIQSVISTGFQSVERTLERILFLQEASDVLNILTLSFQLDRVYSGDEVGHFRAFCLMHLKEPKLKIFGIIFGSSDNSERMRHDARGDGTPPKHGIKDGISGGQWEEYVDLEAAHVSDKDSSEDADYQLTGSSSGIGSDVVEFITAQYRHDDSLIRFRPRVLLRDIDEATIMPVLNRSLAEKLSAIHIYANGYKLLEIARADLMLDPTTFDPKIQMDFTKEELSDPWVRIRPAQVASAFNISFSDRTPKKLYLSEPIHDSLAQRRRS